MVASPRYLTTLALLAAACLVPERLPAEERPAGKTAENVIELKVEPAALSLTGPRDGRSFVVRGKTADGIWIDLTRSARLQVKGDCIRLEGSFAEPVKDGQAEIVISAAGKQAILAVKVQEAAQVVPVSFVRDVMPILGKAGCNAGTCHGGAKGRNGFRLSLRGYDPQFDYEQIVEDIAGRRIDRNVPANSLVLLKSSQGVPHEGKLVLPETSRLYKIFYQWVAEGCRLDVGSTRRAARIEIFPQLPILPDIGYEQQLIVVAHYPDGSSRDVTREAIYTSSNENVCSVSGDGLVKGIRKGESAILIRYEGQFAVNPVTVLTPNPNFVWTNPPAFNSIDPLVYQKLQRIKVLPSELSSDADFLRRVYLDLIGIPPTPQEVRAFLADQRETQVKRREVIDQLLDRPEYVDFWTMRLADLMQVNRKFLGEKGTWAFRDWIREQVRTDRPWNEIAYELLTGVGGTAQAPSSAFYRIARDPGQAVENATHLFLGIRFNCNKCHDHPFERWTLGNYYHLAAYFAQVGTKKGLTPDDVVVYERRDGGEMTNPKNGAVLTPQFPFEHAGFDPKNPGKTRREQLARWMTAPENPYFAKSMANRLWSYLIGKGIIDPVDDIRAGNPPSNPELLDALTADFVKHKMSIRHLLRTIANSRTYQLSIAPNATNASEQDNFARARPRRLTAEQLLDTVRVATGTQNRFPGFPPGARASQLPDPGAAKVSFLEQFGRPVRESPCECERRNEMSMEQAMALVNGPIISEAVADPNGRVAGLFRNKLEDRQIVEELFLAALCRLPTPQESDRFADVLARAKNKQEAAQDILWALLNTSAFLFNR